MFVKRVELAFAVGAALWLAAPWASAEDLTRQQAAGYLAECEKVWYNQAYLSRVKVAEYQSIEQIDATRLYSHGVELFAIAGNRAAIESFHDRRGLSHWERERSIISSDGKQICDWTDWVNEGSIAAGNITAEMNDPNGIYRYFGFVSGRPLSRLIADAEKFEWGKEPEDIEGAKCVKATCQLAAGKSGETEMFELHLAVDGALYPKRITRWVDRGDGMRRAAVWESLKEDRDPNTNVWQLLKGRHFNLGARMIHEISVLKRRPIGADAASIQAFALRFPPDARVLDRRNGKVAAGQSPQQGLLHEETSLIPVLVGVSLKEAQQQLDATYKQGAPAPVWGPSLDAAPAAAAPAKASAAPAGSR